MNRTLRDMLYEPPVSAIMVEQSLPLIPPRNHSNLDLTGHAAQGGGQGDPRARVLLGRVARLVASGPFGLVLTGPG